MLPLWRDTPRQAGLSKVLGPTLESRGPSGRCVGVQPGASLHCAVHASGGSLVNTGLRWSEQARLHWLDVDLLTGFLTVRFGKNGQARWVPLNSAARGALVDLAGQRHHPGDPDELVCRGAYPHREPRVRAGRSSRSGDGPIGGQGG